MIQIVAMDGIEIHRYAADYSISISRVESDNQFKSVSGKDVRKLMGHETVISCKLKKVPHETAQKIAKIVTRDSFDLQYTTPLEITKKFCCTRYAPTPKCTDPRQKNPLITDKITWDIELALRSADISADDGDGL